MSEPSVRGLVGACILLVVLTAVAVARHPPPPPVLADAPPNVFSAERAVAVLARVLGDAGPHPVGSQANRAIAERLRRELTALGLAPQIQETTVCGAWGSCARVRNLIARRPGREPGGALLLTAHYDSVATSPGAGDDGAGVAALLETTRALGADSPSRRGLILLLTDGEENGLLGARAFIEEHPWMRDVAAVLNFEARGTGGPSLMFETGPGSGELVRVWARVCPDPRGTSLAAAIYERMPNDTDFSIYRDAGIPGLNFAFVGGLERYHTPRDDLGHLDHASVQHHGDCALALARALTAEPLPPPPAERVFFEAPGLGIVSWPTSASRFVAILSAVLWLGCVLGLRRRDALSARALGVGLLALPLALAFAVLLALSAQACLRAGTGVRVPWLALLLPLALPFWLAAAVAIGAAGAVVARRAGFWGTWAGVWGWHVVLGALAVVLLPGASYAVLVPAIVAGGSAALLGAVRRPAAAVTAELAALLAFGVAAWIGQPALVTLRESLGSGVALSASAALVASGALPLVVRAPARVRNGVSAILLALGLVAVPIEASRPLFDADRPQPVSILLIDEAGRDGVLWAVSARAADLPPRLVERAGLGGDQPSPVPFFDARGAWRTGPADAPRAAAPELLLLGADREPGGRRLRFHLRSARSAPLAGVSFPPETELREVTIDGASAPPLKPRALERSNGWSSFSHATLPPEGVLLEVSVAGDAPFEVVVYDATGALPAQVRPVLDARPPEAVPVQHGDLWIASRRVRLPGS